MVERACVMIAKSNLWSETAEKRVRAALEAVEAELCAQEPGPFVLTEAEDYSLRSVESGDEDEMGSVAAIVRRALRTIGPQLAQLVAEGERLRAEIAYEHQRSRAQPVAQDPQPAQGGEWTEEDAGRLRRAHERRLQLRNGEANVTSLMHALNECFPRAKPVAQEPTAPVPMRLPCPVCSTLHIDIGEFATKVHHTHACQHCGHVWRPAVIPTVGVEFLPGFQNEPAPSEPADPVRELLANWERDVNVAPGVVVELRAALAARDARKASKP
jgi:hypothetical protein